MEKFIKGSHLMLFDENGKSFAFATNHTLTVSTETSEVASKDHGMYGAVEVTKYNWEITSENLFTVGDFAKLFDKYIGGQQMKVKFGLRQGEQVTGSTTTAVDPQSSGDTATVVDDNTKGLSAWTLSTQESYKDYYCGYALITNLTVNAQNNEVSTYNLTLTGVGKIAHCTQASDEPAKS